MSVNQNIENSQAASQPDDRQELARFVKSVVCILVLALLGQAFVIESCPVQGPSMLPTLHENERILVWKLPVLLRQLPGLHDLRVVDQGDLLVFDSRDEANKRYVKRVIAEGPPPRSRNVVNASTGDAAGVRVRYENGDVYVNNRRVEEPYLPHDAVAPHSVHEVTLGPGEYYVLGDNRPVSKDSRYFDAVDSDQVVGKALLRFWPPSQFGLL